MIDKRITARRNFKGGADASQFDKPTSQQKTPNVSAGGASFNDLGPGPSGADYKRSRQEFVDNLNRNNASRFEPSFKQRTYKPVTLDTVGSRNQRSGFGLQNLIGLALGIPMPGMFKSFRSGLTSLGDKLGDFREKTTGYRTQEEYDNARQQRINLNRINTIQNTLNTKYADGDYSNTDLDERLAALRSQMGIVPNTAEQDAQQFLDFGNDLAINTEQSIIPNQDITTYMAETNTPFYKPDTGINTLRFVDNNSMSLQPDYLMPNTNKQPILESSPQYASREYPFFPYSGSV